MKLAQLIEGLPVNAVGSTDVEISDITFDSRRVKTGSLFIALRGVHQDGRRFIGSAIASGAKAILTDEKIDTAGAALVLAADPIAVMAPLAVRFWDRPSEKLLMVGITGTNGKTTTSYLVESIFTKAGLRPGVLGTISYRFDGESVPAPNTTPFATELQRFLASVAKRGGKSCVMEVSSHALALGRVEGVSFDMAVFTNLTQDHLDFHSTLENYAAAKRKLFESIEPKSSKPYSRGCVINGMDPFGARMAEASRVQVLTYRVQGPADVYAKQVQSDASGSRFELIGPDVHIPIHLPLIGEYNIANALAAATVGICQNIPQEVIRDGLNQAPAVPGRMELVRAGQPFSVVVDYAHTDDALRHVLQALRRLQPKKLITVFGCGGDRDRTKRPLMGEAAARLSDEVLVTSDNPRSEDPVRITLDIEVGLRRSGATNYRIIVDREEAIAEALRTARAGDIVLIAGKGHETYQIVGDKTLPFDDREVARRILTGSAAHS